jgi:molybdopterin converting factor small subunit
MENTTSSSTNSILVRILFFAQAREQTKTSEAQISFSSLRTYKPKEILDSILNNFPALKPLEHCLILARNQNYLDFDSKEEILFKSADEVAVIPPISAGIYYTYTELETIFILFIFSVFNIG